MRKFLFIIIIAVVLLIVGAGIFYVYRIFFEDPAQENQTNQVDPGLEQDQEKFKISPVSDYESLGFFIADKTKEVFYFDQQGRILKPRKDKDVFLSNVKIPNLRYFLASPSGEKVIVAFGKPWQTQYSVFNLIENLWQPLPLEIKKITWSPDEKSFLALYENNLVITDLKGKPLKTLIKNFGLKDLNMKWLSENEIYFWDKPSFLPGRIWRYHLTTKEFAQIMEPSPNLFIKWLTDKAKFLKLQEYETLLVSSAGKIMEQFPYYLLPSKCDLKQETLFCFHPKFFPETKRARLEGWLGDYLKRIFLTEDNLFSLNLGEKILILAAELPTPIDAFGVKIVEDKIYFLNRIDNKIYQLNI